MDLKKSDFDILIGYSENREVATRKAQILADLHGLSIADAYAVLRQVTDDLGELHCVNTSRFETFDAAKAPFPSITAADFNEKSRHSAGRLGTR